MLQSITLNCQINMFAVLMKSVLTMPLSMLKSMTVSIVRPCSQLLSTCLCCLCCVCHLCYLCLCHCDCNFNCYGQHFITLTTLRDNTMQCGTQGALNISRPNISTIPSLPLIAFGATSAKMAFTSNSKVFFAKHIHPERCTVLWGGFLDFMARFSF